MQRIESAIDHRYAILARQAIGASRVQVFDRQYLFARQPIESTLELILRFDAHEMLSGMKPRCAQQQWILQFAASRWRPAREPPDQRCDYMRQLSEAPCVLRATRQQHALRCIEDRRMGARDQSLRSLQASLAQICIT